MYLLHELNISECYRTTGCRSGPELAVVLVDLSIAFLSCIFQKQELALLAEEAREG